MDIIPQKPKHNLASKPSTNGHAPTSLTKFYPPSLKTLGFASYDDYLRSELWDSIRKRVFAEMGRKCFRCCRNTATQVHHISYALDVMRGDNIEPLRPVCEKCHKIIHRPKAVASVLGMKSAHETPRRDRRDRRDFLGGVGVLQELEAFLNKYIVLPDTEILVIACWVVASWLTDIWDRFPHLAVTSPQKRCGKTRLLQLLQMLTPNARHTSNITPAAVYRWIEQMDPKPTLLLDEAQSIQRRISESSEVLRELLNAGIDKDATVVRVGGEGHNEIEEFHIYSPKCIALIGDLDGVLADRCLHVDMKRKTDPVEKFRSRLVKPEGEQLRSFITNWTEANRELVTETFDELDEFEIDNDRLAELLLPLQAVLTVADVDRLPKLAAYAESIDQKDAETESPGIRLLIACRELFGASTNKRKPRKARDFIQTSALLSELCGREEEPWSTYTRGHGISAEALANLLRPFKIRSRRNTDQTARGYYASDFADAYSRAVSNLNRNWRAGFSRGKPQRES